MGIADLKIGTVILPRTQSPKLISRLTEFEWYHKIDSDNDLVTPEIDDLLLKAQQTYQSIDEVLKGIGIPQTVGIMEILFKGTVIKKKIMKLVKSKIWLKELPKKHHPLLINLQNY